MNPPSEKDSDKPTKYEKILYAMLIPDLDLMVKCVGAHDRCYGGAEGECLYCEPVYPLRKNNGQFAKIP